MKSILVMFTGILVFATNSWAGFAVKNVNIESIRVACYYMPVIVDEVTVEEAAESSKAGNKSTANMHSKRAARDAVKMMLSSPKKSGLFGDC